MARDIRNRKQSNDGSRIRCKTKTSILDSLFDDGLPNKDDQHHRLNGRRLAFEMDHSEIDISKANLVFIKSPKGSGKTKFFSQYLQSMSKHKRVLAMVHRRSLAKSLASNLDLICYLDNGDFQDEYVISVDSLTKFDIEKDLPYDILILDESEQVFRHLLSETTEKNRGKIFRVLVWLIQKARQIVCADADLTSELTGHLISKLRSSFEQDRIISVVNEWNSGRAIQVYESKQHLLAELMAAIADGKRVYVPVGELALANSITSIIDAIRGPDGKPISVLKLTGETSDDDESLAFFNNPNEETPKYQVLIATSTLSTGVSIDVEWFDAVYGLFDRSVYTYQDCDQAISRVRKCDTVKIWIHRGVKARFGSEQAIRLGPVKKEMLTRSYAIPDDDGKLSYGDELYMLVETRIRWCEQWWRDNRTEQFIDLKLDEGWTVNRIAKNPAMIEAGDEMLTFGKDPDGDKYYKSVFNADNLSGEEFDELKDQKNVRGPKGKALAKYWIAHFFELKSPAEVTMAQIRAYKEHDPRGIMKNAKLLTATRIASIDRDRMERENVANTRAFTSYDHRTAKRDIFLNAQAASGIHIGDVLNRAKLHVENEATFNAVKADHHANSREYRMASKKRKDQKEKLRYVVTQDQIDSLADYVNGNLSNVNLFFGTNFKTPTAPENKMKVFNTVMGQLGIEIKKRPKKNGQDRPEYFVDYDRVAELVATKDLSEFAGL
jgi:hypothetical protein